MFAKRVREFTRKIEQDIGNREDARQVVRSSGSVGANYIEANEALSKKDFLMRVKISRKEAKESAYWLRLLLETNDQEYGVELRKCLDEATELKKILSAIIAKSG